ncbi:hypothetical protein ACQ31_gp107 [Salmonella phage STML-198]|uniref:Lipoprotein n=1 Tax=Salmonella phage STML-198 TaxID=1204531 RepID=K4I5Z7_9CAUD|nr:hypothetical protein ACQ31_gp107 [Salmonella phage STML-198]AFU63990.1 hypothetical protein [Salmonella phage STML-198]
MKFNLKSLIVIAATTLAGCSIQPYSQPHYGSEGNLVYKPASGMVYTRATSQVSQETLNAIKEIEERRANSPLEAAIKKSVAEGDERQAALDKKEKAIRMCEFVVEAHEEVLREQYFKNTNNKTRLAVIHYRSGGKVKAFNKCMAKNAK